MKENADQYNCGIGSIYDLSDTVRNEYTQTELRFFMFNDEPPSRVTAQN